MTKDYIALGKLLSPFAVEGGIKVKSFSGEVGHFKKIVGTVALLSKDGQHKKLKVLRVVIKGETPVLFFEGYDSPEVVKSLGGYELWVTRSYGLPLEQDEFYMGDLIGCHLCFSGEKIATIIAFIEASTLMLEAQRDDGTTFFIPFIRHFIGSIDLDQHLIELLNDELI